MVKKQYDVTRILKNIDSILNRGTSFLTAAQSLTVIVSGMIEANRVANQQAWANIEEEAIVENTPYKILGVFETSSEEEIKAVYRARVKFHHPDKGGDPEIFEMIQAAYNEIKKERGFK
ncbi:MAG: DnaJ domain-containing protein [bacterium]|nr:DnaJ domain-containing protein [bacterium]